MRVATKPTWILPALALTALPALARATPSTQIWIPSTDVQKFFSPHLNYDVYARASRTPLLVLGPTVGILPWNKLQAEVGFDLMFQGNHDLDSNPLYLHAKLGTPEDSLFKWSPATAVGIYNIGTKSGLTDQDPVYGLLARTLPVVGRLSAGYFLGNKKLLLDENGAAANKGLMLSWDRTMSEISDKLWVAVDYQGGKSVLGALNFGFAWSFSSNVSVICGYDRYLDEKVAGKDTFTVQLDINV
jgi:hypothetical protein